MPPLRNCSPRQVNPMGAFSSCAAFHSWSRGATHSAALVNERAELAPAILKKREARCRARHSHAAPATQRRNLPPRPRGALFGGFGEGWLRRPFGTCGHLAPDSRVAAVAGKRSRHSLRDSAKRRYGNDPNEPSVLALGVLASRSRRLPRGQTDPAAPSPPSAPAPATSPADPAPLASPVRTSSRHPVAGAQDHLAGRKFISLLHRRCRY